MTEIVLATLNARFAHTAFGLRYLKANLGEIEEAAVIREFTISQQPLDIVAAIVALKPRIVGFGVYIWNVIETEAVIAILSRVLPDVVIVLGGPEVSHETEGQRVTELADYVICGEADHEFRRLAQRILAGDPPTERILVAPAPDLAGVRLPYYLYSDDDLRRRTLYVESSRGCPFRCEFCLSSLPGAVRTVGVERFLAEMRSLVERGGRHFKFVDRTFNLDPLTATRILRFLSTPEGGERFAHFEMVPGRVTEEMMTALAAFGPGTLQLEIGVQTFNPAVAKRISRRLDADEVERAFATLVERTEAHLHADLIAGLPGEDLDSFAAGFDRLVALGPHEIQVGILKRLRGAPIARHDEAWAMVYSPTPPYEVLSTSAMDFATLQHLRIFARAWELLANSGNFLSTAPLIWGSGSPFWGFDAFVRWLYERTGQMYGIALLKLTGYLFDYLVRQRGVEATELAPMLLADYQRSGRSDVPKVLRPHLPEATKRPSRARSRRRSVMARQGRHLE